MATGGYRSYTGIWEGGASAPPTVGGYRSYEAIWLGGASSPATNPPVIGGYRSFEAVWLGGASSTATSVVFRPGGDDDWRYLDKLTPSARTALERRIKQEDDEIMAIFVALWR